MKPILSLAGLVPFAAGLALSLCAAPPARAQANAIPGLDVKLQRLRDLTARGRTGTFPTGRNGLAMETTVCNIGTVDVPWVAAMDPRHPKIAFLLVRESGGRLEQISDRSYVKHGFFSTNSSDCSPCPGGGGGVLVAGCSDTYSSQNNGDRNWLGPAGECDPWLGTWDPVCSHFDQGEPPVAPPNDCDGIDSLTSPMIQALGPVAHRVEVDDADLNDPAARYFYWAQYVVEGEDESVRRDDSGSVETTPFWDGSEWTFTDVDSLVRGTILNRWTGSSVHAATNGVDDGRVFVGSVVTGPDLNGMYHYEYALHNRDNGRGVGALEIPVCPSAQITNFAFRDIDADPGNDWSASHVPGKVVFSTPDNPLEWNTIYNFSFDADVAPASGGKMVLQQFRSGAGAGAFAVAAELPLGASPAVDLGFGKAGGNGLEPQFWICGSLGTGQQAEIQLRYAAPSTLAMLVLSDQNNPTPFQGGTLVPVPPVFVLPFVTSPQGELLFTTIGPGGGPFSFFFQFVVFDPVTLGFSNALDVTIDP